MTKPIPSVVAFLARSHGLATFEALVGCREFRLIAVFTHRRTPKVEHATRPEREDYTHFAALASKHEVPLFSVDSVADTPTIDSVLANGDTDLLVSVSWRRIIPPKHLEAARLGGLNVHRGQLPDYAGAEPIKRALLDGRKEIIVSAHVLVEEIDAGEVLATRTLASNYDRSKSLDENVERLKVEITPFFAPLTLEGLRTLRDRRVD